MRDFRTIVSKCAHRLPNLRRSIPLKDSFRSTRSDSELASIFSSSLTTENMVGRLSGFCAYHDLPGAKSLCNDFVVGPDKLLYISDTFGARIWRLKPGAAVPELFSDDRTLYGIDGITFIGESLYENNVVFNKLYRVPIDAAGKAEQLRAATIELLLIDPKRDIASFWGSVQGKIAVAVAEMQEQQNQGFAVRR